MWLLGVPSVAVREQVQLVSEEAPVVTERPVLSGHTVMETLVRHNTPAMNKDNSLTSITAPGFR